MGHTLVTRFSPESHLWIHQLMQPFQANKIPFGRKCDREIANAVLDYHITLFHWSKISDAYYLERIKNLKSSPFQVLVTGIHIMRAEEGSSLLFFSVEPKENFANAQKNLIETFDFISGFLHITLAVSLNHNEIDQIKQQIESQISFPVLMDVEGFDLYEIWTPTRKVKSL